jgi:hypothetical protein
MFRVLLGMAAAAVVVPAVAAEVCSIHPPQGSAEVQLETLAKVSRTTAQKVALAAITEKKTVTVLSAELEAEHNCLIWSFDLRVAGESGIQEVQVDAGDEKVLSVKHESPRQEAAEAKQEAGAQKK